MNVSRRLDFAKAIRIGCLMVALGFATQGRPSVAQTARPIPDVVVAATSASVARDGQHDFDFEIGTWTIAVRRLVRPLTGSTTWIKPQGFVHIVRKVWGGRASLAELKIDRPTPHFEGLMLRLYNPQSHRWSIYWASAKDGALDTPLTGRFENGRGVFLNKNVFNGALVDVRVVYSDITPTSFRTEQSFSADGGKTWEPNLIQTFARRKPQGRPREGA